MFINTVMSGNVFSRLSVFLTPEQIEMSILNFAESCILLFWRKLLNGVQLYYLIPNFSKSDVFTKEVRERNFVAWYLLGPIMPKSWFLPPCKKCSNVLVDQRILTRTHSIG